MHRGQNDIKLVAESVSGKSYITTFQEIQTILRFLRQKFKRKDMESISLQGKHAFIAGVGDDVGFGWAIAKKFKEAGAKVSIGVWAPMLRLFIRQYEGGKWDSSRRLSNGSLMEFDGIFPFDASFDTPDQVPSEILENKRYKEIGSYTLSEVSQKVHAEIGPVDILAHCLANAPEIGNELLDTSRKGYLDALNTSSYSLIALLKHFGPNMPSGSSAFSLTYIAGSKVITGYGGGMSSAKAALEHDTRQLAWEAGRRWNMRINTISAGPMRSRAAKAIGGKELNFIDRMICYCSSNSPLNKEISAEDIANCAQFLSSPMAQSITGTTLYVDNGFHVMGSSPQLTTHPQSDANLEHLFPNKP